MENSLQIVNKDKRENRISIIPEGIQVTTIIIDQLKQDTDNLIYTNNNFFIYMDGYWQMKEEYMVMKFLQDYAREIGYEEKYYKYHKKADDLLKQAKLDFYTQISTNRLALNFQNGTYELDTMTFREHRKEDYLFYSLPYPYDAKADCPKWKAFIKEVLPQEDLQTAIQEGLAYPLSGLHLEKIIYLFGSGRNGKSVTLEVISSILGRENVSNVPLANITKNDGLSLQQMVNKLINISHENSSKIFESSVLKSYISGEPLDVKELYKDTYTTTNYPQTIMASNSMPQSDDYSEGYYRRFIFIPFNVTIPKERVNPNLKEELCEESSGILNWLLEGVKRLKENKKFTYSPTIEELQSEYRIESDNVSMFLEEKMYIPSLKNKQLLSQVYNEFNSFLNENGFREISNRTFSSRMKALGFKIERLSQNKTYVWIEIGIKKNDIIAQESQIVENKVEPIESEDWFGDDTECAF